MTLEIIQEGRFKYIESNKEGEVILLLHGTIWCTK
jgi:hypothetical protein